MNADAKDARRALEEIERAKEKSMTLHGYAASWPIPVIWGLVWLGANLATYFGVFAQWAWPIGILIGTAGTCLVVARIPRELGGHGFDARMGFRFAATFAVIIGGLIALGSVLDIPTSDQTNAMISLLVAIMYMMTGLFQGARIFIAGAAIAAAVLVGFHGFRDYFELWMAFIGGGVLIGTGLWLRTAA